jgi:hypothetical protein
MVLPKQSWNWYEEILKKLGNNEIIDLSEKSHTIEFLHEIGLIRISTTQLGSNGKPLIELTDNGKEYYISKYCTNEQSKTKEIITKIIEDYRPVKLMIQVFWGNPNVKRENVKNLLCHHKIIDNSFNIGHFLSVLNYYNIISYSKKHQSIKINTEPIEIEENTDYFVSKSKPYSNLLKIKKMIEEAKENINWFEKHFSSKMYELLSYHADGNKIKNIKILTGIEHIDDNVRNDFKRLKKELQNKGIAIEHRIMIDKSLVNSIHGRWFITKKYTYNIPPINTILQGQSDEIILREKGPDFNKWWNSSCDIVKDWNEINKCIGEKNG